MTRAEVWEAVKQNRGVVMWQTEEECYRADLMVPGGPFERERVEGFGPTPEAAICDALGATLTEDDTDDQG